MANKTRCPIDRSTFRQHAKALDVVIDGVPYKAIAKEFSTGSLGWNINGKASITVNGVACEVQIGMNCTIIGSKTEAESPAA